MYSIAQGIPTKTGNDSRADNSTIGNKRQQQLQTVAPFSLLHEDVRCQIIAFDYQVRPTDVAAVLESLREAVCWDSFLSTCSTTDDLPFCVRMVSNCDKLGNLLLLGD